MKTGTGNRNNYNRTTGSRTARLYSKRTAKKLNKAYQESQKERIRHYREDEWNGRYNDYYDIPPKNKKKDSSGSTALFVSIITALTVAVVVLILIMNSRNGGTGAQSVQETSLAAAADVLSETAAEEEITTEMVTYEESDPPVIYGVMPIVVYANHSVAYKQGVLVKDDTDSNPTLEIDNEEVDLSTPGNYIISYIARDKDNNVTREFTTVTVMEGQNEVSDEEIYALADKVINNLITDDMTDEMKCLKIYEYLHSIGYVDEVHSEDWMQNAYWMLTKREGDCFCYYSAARLLLTRLGYEVMEVRNNNNYVHFWCLVSIDKGETWWHFDATCWSWGEDGVLCLVSDNYLDSFTRRHMTSDGRLIHSWNRNNYPATPEYDFWTDADREVIYEGGLIDLDATYDEYAEWENDGWDDYFSDYETYYEEEYYEYVEEPEVYTDEWIEYEEEYSENDYIPEGGEEIFIDEVPAEEYPAEAAEEPAAEVPEEAPPEEIPVEE